MNRTVSGCVAVQTDRRRRGITAYRPTSVSTSREAWLARVEPHPYVRRPAVRIGRLPYADLESQVAIVRGDDPQVVFDRLGRQDVSTGNIRGGDHRRDRQVVIGVAVAYDDICRRPRDAGR